MKFEYKNFSCDVDIFYKEDDLLIRFYDSSNEQEEDEIINLVIVDPGFGYLYIKFKGDAALIGGFLDEEVFSSDELVDAAIDFIENLSPKARNIYIPHHVDCVKRTSFVEYNGEY
ncbi:hypothetical protein [Pseudobacteroides cellulosolvens]|uniref:Uncharacterized protein n=1 Tax=Pseudobacteroides cellulosolvens ATCC 35603 = DSM 2933 TaxID=398512 RepID=A0A0L6JNG6_9FIRM|nr:hypothetical protein [Pseudobacteroides cellulosolvens]KNY26897.1 hypothetical protein Bccel_2162 [Pseudobacteroides cellulosolvens ATCC 35603 = DSM 2933]